MKIMLYREIVRLLRDARRLPPSQAQIPYSAANVLAGFAYETKIICPSEYLAIISHFQERFCAAGNRSRLLWKARKIKMLHMASSFQ